MSSQCVTWQWLPNRHRHTVCAAVALNDVRLKLVHHLLDHVDEALYAQLQIVTHKDVIILIAEQSLLPWVDGLQYVMHHASEPGLWLPTHVMPSVSIDLLAEALYLRYQLAPLLLWNNPQIIIPLNKPQMISKALLNTILNNE